MPPKIELKPLPPEEAIRFFESKGYRTGFDWRDVWQEEHAHAFTVAKAMRADILADIREAVDSALRNGETLQQFSEKLTPILQKKGWWGRKPMADPKTGEIIDAQLGSPRRLRTIFDTNMRMAHAAGRWERIERTAERMPFLRYSAILDDRVRPEHEAWHGTILPKDDDFWKTHYPPNGWRCRCKVIQLSGRQMKKRGMKRTPRPPVKTREWVNKRTGEVLQVPEGIDPGFDYNVGLSRMRALAPPPLEGPITTPAAVNRPAAVPMPPPRSAPASRLLPSGLKDEEYVSRFLREFGATRRKSVVFRDVLDEPVVISEDFFRSPDGRLKVQKRGRERSLLLLADTIKNPDEIWWAWQEFPKGRRQLVRRYVARWEIEGQPTPAFAMMEIGRNGWKGVTAFSPSDEAYLMRQRRGVLAWRRK